MNIRIDRQWYEDHMPNGYRAEMTDDFLIWYESNHLSIESMDSAWDGWKAALASAKEADKSAKG